jgi:hypothetical protein
MEKQARRLARMHAELDPSIEEIYWFPNESRLLLVELDPMTIRSFEFQPIYLNADVEAGIDFPSGVAVIRPEERRTLPIPEDWGSWDTTVRVLNKTDRANSLS